MKPAILIFSLLFLLLGKAHAQFPLAGTWRWVSNKDTFEIMLRPVTEKTPKKPWPLPDLFGYHRYIQNGVPLESSFMHNREELDHTATISGRFYGTRFSFGMREILSNRDYDGKIEKMSGCDDCLLFSMKWTREMREPDTKDAMYSKIRRLPDSVVLKKVR